MSSFLLNHKNVASGGNLRTMSCGLACLIKPKSQMGGSYPLYLVHILILLGFAEKIKFLAVPEVRPNLTSSSAEKYKGFSKFIKGKIFGHVF